MSDAAQMSVSCEAVSTESSQMASKAVCGKSETIDVIFEANSNFIWYQSSSDVSKNLNFQQQNDKCYRSSHNQSQVPDG